MGRLILITCILHVKDRHGYPTGEKKLITSHGINEDTHAIVVVPCEHPKDLGGIFDPQLQEWVIPERPLTLKATAKA